MRGKHVAHVTSPKLCLGEVEASASKLREGAALPKLAGLVALGPLPQTSAWRPRLRPPPAAPGEVACLASM